MHTGGNKAMPVAQKVKAEHPYPEELIKKFLSHPSAGT